MKVCASMNHKNQHTIMFYRYLTKQLVKPYLVIRKLKKNFNSVFAYFLFVTFKKN